MGKVKKRIITKWDRANLNYDVVNTLRFYLMLSIKMVDSGYGQLESEKSLKQFIAEGEDWHNNNLDVKNAYIQKAYDTLPTEFLQIYHMQIDLENKGW